MFRIVCKSIFLIVVALSVISCSRKVPIAKRDHYKREKQFAVDKSPKHSEGYKSVNDYNYLKADGLTANPELISFVDDWLGVPHRIGGKSKAGIDCSGLVTAILKDVYRLNFSGSSYTMAEHVEPLRREELREGDLVFFKINSSRVSHVGLYLSDNYFVHATLRRGVMISSLDEDYYKKYYSSSGRVIQKMSTR